MKETTEKILKVSVVIIVLIVIPLFLLYFHVKYEKECTYETEVVVGIVSNKGKHNNLSCMKPAIYTTIYKTEVIISGEVKITLSGYAIFNACEIGDEILIEVEYKYHDGRLVNTNYKMVDSKKND